MFTIDVSKILDKKNIIFIPIGIIALTTVFTIGSVAMSRVSYSKVNTEYKSVKADLEKLQSEKEDNEKKQKEIMSDIASAADIGDKVAKKQSQYCENMCIIANAKSDHSEYGDSSQDTIKNAESENADYLKTLSNYFSDDSYKDAWFVTDDRNVSIDWSFATKYSLSTSDDDMTVVWVGTDKSDMLLAYTVANYNITSQKFSNARVIRVITPGTTYSSKVDNSDLLSLLNSDKVASVHDSNKTDSNKTDSNKKYQDDKTNSEDADVNSNEDSDVDSDAEHSSTSSNNDVVIKDGGDE